MFRFPGLPKDISVATTTEAAEPENSNFCSKSADPTPIQPILSTSKTAMSTTTTTLTLPARTIIQMRLINNPQTLAGKPP